jgi:hypothetical protein
VVLVSKSYEVILTSAGYHVTHRWPHFGFDLPNGPKRAAFVVRLGVIGTDVGIARCVHAYYLAFLSYTHCIHLLSFGA